MSGGWPLARCREACSRCAAPFAAEQDLWSLLCFDGAALTREDLCRACMEARDAGEDVVWWRTRARRGATGLRVDFELLLQAMARLAGDPRDEAKDLAFLLALLLVRHRRLRLLRVEARRGREVLVLRKVHTTREFPVEAREWSEERRQALSATLAGLLDPTQEAGLDTLIASQEDVSD